MPPPDDERKTVLLTGASGQIGCALKNRLQNSWHVVAPTHHELDLEYTDAIRQYVHETQPALIINAAAYTAVDAAETEAEQAFAINATAPGALAREAKTCGAAFIHYSTDYVFDGKSKRPYRESDAAVPLSVYGQSKLAGEKEVADSGADFVILRTSWVYSDQGQNFLNTIRRLASERDEISIVDDQYGSPTWAEFIADRTEKIIALCGPPGGTKFGDISGLYHLSASGEISWYEFAKTIVAHLPKPQPRVIPIPSSEYPLPARRPARSVLDNSLIRDRLGIEMPSWQVQLESCLNGQLP